jgi:TfuA protein
MFKAHERPIVFGGPSLQYLIPAVASRIEVRPPVRRGDFTDLLARDRPGTVVLTDGIFASSLAVTPTECRELLERGWTVAGASSMGALRASELWSVGMIGIGEVYTLYRLGVLRSDADVAVALDVTTNAELTASMVHVRAVLSVLEQEGEVSSIESRRYVRLARSIHWSRRDWRDCVALWSDEGMSEKTAARVLTLASDPAQHPKVRDVHLAINSVLAHRWVQHQ